MQTPNVDEKSNLSAFLVKNRIEQSTWEASGLAWETLKEIAVDHESKLEQLRDSAELFARVIQRLPGVHSVRWRIKDTEHLLTKIVRKCAEKKDKYKDIGSGNYFEIVTDLVGLRALHLFKEDCFSIDTHLRETWEPIEDPIAYVRQGDPTDLLDKFTQLGFRVEKHPAGYRSVHYVFTTQPLRRKIFAEIQVRTIFEEGWSEIDHRVRYPNFSDNELVSYFLAIFNRLAGSADEMGTFVQGLTTALDEFELNLNRAKADKETALEKMEGLLSDIETMKQQDATTKEKVNSLQKEITKLRVLSSDHTSPSANGVHLSSQSGLNPQRVAGNGTVNSLLELLRRAENSAEALRKATQSNSSLDIAREIKNEGKSNIFNQLARSQSATKKPK